MRRANVFMMCPFLDVRKRVVSQVLFRETWKSQYKTANRVNEQIRRYRVHNRISHKESQLRAKQCFACLHTLKYT